MLTSGVEPREGSSLDSRLRQATNDRRTTSAPAVSRGVLILGAATVLAAAAVLVIVLDLVSLSSEWLIGTAIGFAILLVTLLFDAVLVHRSRQPFEVALVALRAASDDLVRTNAALADSNRALVETAEDRSRALAQLQASIEERERFLQAVTHDLRTPLTVIKGSAQMLQKRIAAPCNGREPVALAARIDQTIDQMTDLIDQLVELEEAGAGNLPQLRRGPTDLAALAREAVSRYAQPADGPPIRLDIPTSPVIGDWDARRLVRLLDNLLSNAVKYSPGGGTIRLSVSSDAESAILSVADSGIGIPDHDLPRVFEPYYRGANVAATVPGSGLGLAGARSTAEAHGGTIAVESREGQGTTVIVRLPLRMHPMPSTSDFEAVASDAGT
jgi:signal transduction histidine kinase